MVVSRLNDEVEERREEKRTVSLPPAWAQEPKKYVREISRSYINYEELTIIQVS